MCLFNVKKFNSPQKKSGIGYKIADRGWDTRRPKFGESASPIQFTTVYNFAYRPLRDCRRIVFGKWLIAEEFPLSSEGFPRVGYTSGFHIYAKLSDARRILKHYGASRIVKVQYKEAHTEGEQDLAQVVVAKQVKFLKLVPDTKEKK